MFYGRYGAFTRSRHPERMQAVNFISRRRAMGLLCSSIASLGIKPVPVSGRTLCAIDRLAGINGERRDALQLRYRVNATVTLFSIPICSRSDAGGAYAALERVGVDGDGALALQFSAGTWPKQLHGFNRFGFQQEIVVEANGVASESAEFGFMTSAPENDLKEGRNSFASAPNQLHCAVAHSSYTRNNSSSSVEKLSLPAQYSWTDCAEVQKRIRSDLGTLTPSRHSSKRAAEPVPFLYAVFKAIASGMDPTQTTFQHNGESRSLETRCVPDAETGKLLRRRGVARDENAVIAMTGWVRGNEDQESKKVKSAEFRLWFERGSAPLPLRIEFRPRSFLHLILECEPAASGPPINFLMKQEQA